MSEIKGQLLGVVLVLILFGTLSLCLTGIFSDLTGKVEKEASKVGSQLSPASVVKVDTVADQNLLTY